MVLLDNSIKSFFELVRAGLWEKEARLSVFDNIDFTTVYKIAEEQSVIGLVAAGLEHVCDVKIPQEVALRFVGSALQLEQRNLSMNGFIANLIEKLRDYDIYSLLIKGQGIAQCYERPLWRAAGDVDLLLSDVNYKKAKPILASMSSVVDEEDRVRKHIEFNIEKWSVELHGTLRSGLWSKMDKGIDDLQKSVFYHGNVRSWINGCTSVFLLRADEDVVFVFTHILQHFFRGGIGLRQICDWCRVIWTYRESLNYELLEYRLRKMGIMSEWKAFAYLAVNILGMPENSMPFYSSSMKWKRKSDSVLEMVLEAGNFGHNRDMSYISSRSYFIRKCISFRLLVSDSFRRLLIFPIDSVKAWNRRVFDSLDSLIKGK